MTPVLQKYLHLITGIQQHLVFAHSFRLLAIVLTKLFLHGERSDWDLYDYKTNSLERVKCSHKSYEQLLQLCLDPSVKSVYLAAFARSICAYEYSDYQPKFAPK